MRPGQATDPSDTAEFIAFDDLASKFFEAEPRTPVRVEFGARTHPGKVRPNNEDNYLVVRRRRGRDVLLSSLGEGLLPEEDQFAYTLAVADGMGGQHFGELASLLALRCGWELGAGEVKWTVKVNERESEEFEQKANVFFQLIHQKIRAEAFENPRLRGMGTTLTICYTSGPELFVMHAGDSRAYLLRGGELIRLTKDHNRAQQLVDAGAIAPGSPEALRVRHILTNSLGSNHPGVEVDVAHHRLEDGDRLLLCTDGLSDLVDDGEIARTLGLHPEPDVACRALVDLALDRGGGDNITAVVGRYEFPPGESGTDLKPGSSA